MLAVLVMGMPPVCAEEPPIDTLPTPMRGMISVTTQYDPSAYGEEISFLADLGINVANTFHGTPSRNDAFLDLAEGTEMMCIPSIHLICWIRFGDPPYPPSGGLGWPNLLEWLKLYGYHWPDLPEPFSGGPNATDPLSEEQLEAQVSEILGGFGNTSRHPSILAFYAFDEPSANSPGVMDRIARVHSAFCRSGDATITGIFLWNDDGQAAARRYMEKASPKPQFLMYDCYVLRHAIGSNLDDYEGYAEDWAGIGEEFGVPVIAVPQGFSYGKRPAPGELRAQAYLALAAGCKGINWFRLETLRTLGDHALEEVAGINRDLEIIGPTLMKLEKAENAAAISGCGGRYRAGSANTFRHVEDGVKYVFVASKNVTATDLAHISLDEVGIGYPVERILDCHGGGEVGFERNGNVLTFNFALEPGQGRLFRLEGDTTVPMPEIANLLLFSAMGLSLLTSKR